MALLIGAAYRFAMEAFAMRFYWRIGEDRPEEPGLLSLCSTELCQALKEADAVWRLLRDEITPSPFGYLVYDRATGKIIHEWRLDRPMPPMQFESPENTPESTSAWWRWLRL